MKIKREHEVVVLTGQFVSQLIYQSSKLTQVDHDFDKDTEDIIDLLTKYEKKVKKLKD